MYDIAQQPTAHAFFVDETSIVRRIWGDSDTILFIFAGAAAEFALNKAVDWLYFTGKLPADPIGRLFSTVSYARLIVFSPTDDAHAAIDTVRKIHSAVEGARGAAIPDWAYRDVLFMLIHYSITSYELLERRLIPAEKAEVYDVFFRMGTRLGLLDLPASYTEWLPVRDAHLSADLKSTRFTIDLFLQYKRHLGSARYRIMTEVQKLIVAASVRDLLRMKSAGMTKRLFPLYRMLKRLNLDVALKRFLLPAKYRNQIMQLNHPLHKQSKAS
jgi:uncharacterized protein (DUF2236 family)